jgi:RNA polymerase sigma-70 factor (ECF subfamily)
VATTLVNATGIGVADDAELVGALTAALRGDVSGFSQLWLALQPPLLRYLRVLVGDAAEDVASETWLQAARDLGGFQGDLAGFRVWLFHIARHRGIDNRRRYRRRAEDPYDPATQEHLAVSPDAEREALDRLGTSWALRVIASLPPDQAEAVMLRVVAGLDVGQTAAVLGKRAGAVRIATMRGLRRLANHPAVLAQRRARVRGAGAVTAMDSAQPEGV